jgi:hypothetical protein
VPRPENGSTCGNRELTVASYPRDEVEDAFVRAWEVGCVGEDWVAWTEGFTADVEYFDHFWGWFHGRDEVRVWIEPVMKGVPEIYTVLEWYRIDNEVVTFYVQNRRDNPDAEGPEYFDFPGLSILVYAGGGLFSSEEDYWDVGGARRTSIAYAAACDRAGITDPMDRLTRRFWPDGPTWARTDTPPKPSWVGRDDIPAVTKPREIYELLGRERDVDRPSTAPMLRPPARP